MKISIGAYIKEGPWGGGNLFFKNLKNFLENNGHIVINHLLDNDIDLILLTDPRKESESSSYTDIEILKYKKNINPYVKVVHRINECDERKGTTGLNNFIYNANLCSDATVFVSNWIKQLYQDQGLNTSAPHVIMSGSDSKIFNSRNKSVLKDGEKISIVTHHWGGNWNKGFDVYERLDKLMADPDFGNLFEFNYIGNIPDGFIFKNSNLIKPLEGKELAKELKKNHIYITGSKNEPSGNHHIEGALCGLPVLYINSGALPEYCSNFGIEFHVNNIKEKILEMKSDYEKYQSFLKVYPFVSDTMSANYEKLFYSLVPHKRESHEYVRNDNIIHKLRKVIILKFYNLFRKNKLW